MPVKSVVDIQVNDQEFKEFHALFGKYREALGKTGDAWSDVGKEVKGVQSSFEAVAAALMAQAEMSRRTARDQREQRNETRSTALAWGQIADKAKSFAGHISSATKNMLRWVGIGSLFGGLLGGGGLFGLDRLAQSVGGTRRASLGTGTTYGERQAFGVNYGRVVNPEQFLGGVNEALHDISKRYSLYGAGMSEADLRGKDTAQVGEVLLDKWREIAKNSDPSMLAQTLQSRGGQQFFTVEDLQRMRATPDEEWRRYKAGYAKDKGSMNVTDKMAAAWQDFAVAMSRAGQKIESVFVRGLTPLISPLTKLTDAFGDLVERVLGSDSLKMWIDKLADGLKTFANYITSEKFSDDVRSFVDAIGRMAEATVRALRYFGLIPGAEPEFAGGGFGSWRMGHGSAASRYEPRDPNDPYTLPKTEGEKAADRMHWGNLSQGSTANATANLLGQQRIIDDHLAIIKKLEGSKDWEISRAGAVGAYQIMPGTAQMYDPSLPRGKVSGPDADPAVKAAIEAKLKDPAYNADMARRIVTDLNRTYSGNLTDELIAYNAGPGRANQYEASGQNPAVLPEETRRYLERASRYSPQVGQKTTVEVRNNTGGSAIISSSTLPQ